MLIPAGKCSPHHSARKLLYLLQTETSTEKPNYPKWRVVALRLKRICLKIMPIPNTQGTKGKRKQKDRKRQRIRVFTGSLCLLVVSEVTHIKSCSHDSLNLSITQMTINKQKRTWVGKPIRPQPYTTGS